MKDTRAASVAKTVRPDCVARKTVGMLMPEAGSYLVGKAW